MLFQDYISKNEILSNNKLHNAIFLVLFDTINDILKDYKDKSFKQKIININDNNVETYYKDIKMNIKLTDKITNINNITVNLSYYLSDNLQKYININDSKFHLEVLDINIIDDNIEFNINSYMNFHFIDYNSLSFSGFYESIIDIIINFFEYYNLTENKLTNYKYYDLYNFTKTEPNYQIYYRLLLINELEENIKKLEKWVNQTETHLYMQLYYFMVRTTIYKKYKWLYNFNPDDFKNCDIDNILIDLKNNNIIEQDINNINLFLDKLKIMFIEKSDYFMYNIHKKLLTIHDDKQNLLYCV